MQAQGVGALAQRCGAVAAEALGGDVGHPGVEVVEGLVREVQQRLVGALLVGQAGVVQLLAGPAGFAELVQPDHARAALERVEGPAHGGHVLQVLALLAQGLQGLAGGLADFLGLGQEDLQHFLVQGGGIFGDGRADGRQLRHHRRAGRDQVVEGLRRLGAGLVGTGRGGRAFDGLGAGGVQHLLGRLRGLGDGGLVGGACLQGDEFEAAGQILGRQLAGRHGRGGGLHLAEQVGRVGHRDGRALLATHLGVQAAGRIVEMEHALGELRLHAEHVDEEAQGAQVVGQAIEDLLGAGQARVDLGAGERIDLIAHAHAGQRGLVHAQHAQHAAHALQLARHGDQDLALGGVAEVFVDLALDLGEAGAQLVHDAAQGLAVRDAAVQILHPGFEFLGRLAAGHGRHAPGQGAHAIGLLGLVEGGVIQGGLDVQDGRGHLHGQMRRGRLVGAQRRDDGALQHLAQHGAFGEELAEGLGQRCELLAEARQAVRFTLGGGGPALLGSMHAALGLRHPVRVDAAEALVLVVAGGGRFQVVGGTHGVQARGLAGLGRQAGLGAEEQQILAEAVGDAHLARAAGAQLRQQARAQALGVVVRLQQALGLSLELGRGQLPQGAGLLVDRGRTEARAQLAQEAGVAGRRRAHLLEQRGLEDIAHGIRAQARDRREARHFAPGPFVMPQIRRMHPLGLRQLGELAIGREQGQRGDGIARQHAGDQGQQREMRALDGFDGMQVQVLRGGRQVTQRTLTGAQQLGASRQAHHGHHAHELVQLRGSGLNQLVRALGLATEHQGAAALVVTQHTAQGLVH